MDAFNFCREVCSKYLQRNPIRLGGPGVVVQIDESLFQHKAKYNRGRHSTNVWVFGMVDTSTTPGTGFMQIVETRDADTLLPIIQRVVLPGTTVYSDKWRAYFNIQHRLGLHHQVVNHSLNFVDPLTGVHTQNIESYWGSKKNHIKTMCGYRRDFLEGYLAEYMWRDHFSNDAFVNICNHIAIQHPL